MRLGLIVFISFLAACSSPKSPVSDTEEPKILDSELNRKQQHSNSEVRPDTIRYINYSEEVLVEDLNGDGFPEVISRVAEPKMNKIGVRVLDGKEPDKFTVFGAGNEVDGMTNLLWIGSMQLIPKGETIAATLVDNETGNILGPDTANQVLLQNPAVLFLAKNTHGGGILYWTGKDYAWIHIE